MVASDGHKYNRLAHLPKSVRAVTQRLQLPVQMPRLGRDFLEGLRGGC
jgi:hypothetical protein